MDFALTPERQMLRDTVRDFVRRECTREYARELDEQERFPFEAYQKVAALGWLGLPFPERYGGSDGSIIDVAMVLEELSRGTLAVGGAYMRNTMTNGQTILNFGTAEQKDVLLPGLIRGEFMFAIGLTEPDAGSDAASLQTTAVRDGDDYVLNGGKMFCSAANVAAYIQLATRTDKTVPKQQGITTFLIDPKTPGITIRPIKKVGHKSTVATEVAIQDARVSARNMLGELNGGWRILIHSLDAERVGVAAMCVGAAQSAFEEALEHAKQRVQFGRPIGKFQAVQHKLADMQIAVQAARLLLYHAAWLISTGQPCHKETAAVKVHASDTYMHTALEGMQILAGYGYTMESAMQRHFRDAKLYQFGAGTNEIQRNIIARELGL